MSSSSDPKSASDQGDPWEQLAEDLFGLEFGKEHGSREPSPPVVAPPPTPAPPPVRAPVRVEVRHEPAAVTPAIETPPQYAREKPSRAAEPEFSELVFEDSDSSAPEESSTGSEASTGSISEAPRESVAPPEKREPAAPAGEAVSPQDSYWDALANWNWDESDGSSSKPKAEPSRGAGGPPPRGGPRGRDDKRDDRRDRRGGDKPQRQSSEASPAGSSSGSSRPASAGSAATGHSTHARGPHPAAPSAGDDFGLGLDDAAHGEAAQPAPAPDRGERQSSSRTGSETESPKHDDGAFPKKRRRRRRRRSRGGEPNSNATGSTGPGSAVAGSAGAESPTASTGSDDEWDDDDSAGPESEIVAEESQTPVAEPLGETRDKVEGDRHVSSRGRRRGSRNERPRREGAERRPSSESPRSESPRPEGRGEEGSDEFDEEPVLVGGAVEEPADDGDSENDAVEQAVSYEDVPSWEEAISYLLHPGQVQVEPGTGNGSSPPRQSPQADQPRQTRHTGGQKHRR